MFALVFCFELRPRGAACAVTAISPWKIRFMTASGASLNCQKVMDGNRMWSCDTELCTNGVEANKNWVYIAHFPIYSTSRCRCHAGTDMLRLRGHTLQISQVVRTVRHWISGCAPTIHWKCDARMQNWQITNHQPCEDPVFQVSLLWMESMLACL